MVFFQGNYRKTFENLNENIAFALENVRYAESRLREANERHQTFHRNLQQRQYDYGAMKHQLSLSLAEAEKLNLLKVSHTSWLGKQFCL